MGLHDTYGKAVLRQVAGTDFRDSGVEVHVAFGDYPGGATIDGVVGTDIAIEIESRVPKQIRGALLDLLCHDYPKKLLVLLPVHMSNPRRYARTSAATSLAASRNPRSIG